MQLAALFDQYHFPFMAKYGARLTPEQRQAIRAIGDCRTSAAGEVQVHCQTCDQRQTYPLSCGHRRCPTCQNHEASRWLDRQMRKRLPVDYFMVTFTLPEPLRHVAWENPSRVYAMLFACAVSTLKDFGLNPAKLGADLGMTAVLHTHSRRMDYHPHLHVVVPGGGIDMKRRQWKRTRGKYLFNAFALAKVFRARMLDALAQEGMAIPALPGQWVVDCRSVGSGVSALKYLSRYLYRGVISERNIVANAEGNVTFQYTEARTRQKQRRTLKGEDFLWLVLQHVLPKGLRRVRDYGFLHGNAKKILSLVQLVLHVIQAVPETRHRPHYVCPYCHSPMRIVGIRRPGKPTG